ncbi:hypothetical protein HMPREF1544_11878 [Mucor circinelloides 1006PhL]|uniref:Uncharacterized protein n=1 Tax=Mucor circinelloides f. circinelloides (strain 1006PhL) TaxID=1220926 RepID=S2IUW3_MUCC1|nr:hypothetical protein HMPREF1544_11878 [Mucor circinelloides 1006PhL]KAG1118788.1 hypothetical protein G6F42_013115 [Rhizopus arrhizus]
MGNSASKTKTFSANLRNKINQAMPNHDSQQEPPSPHRTLVESDLSSTPSKMTKPSILQNHSFFNNVRKAKKKSAPIVHQHRQHTSVKNTTLSRKKPRFKKKVIITKSIIGKPTNFKHLTCTRNHADDMDNNDDNNESSAMAAQMIALAALIKPLPDMDPDKTLTPPIIPPRNSSYGNHIYIQQIALSLPSPPSSSSSCSSTVMQHDIPSVSGKSKKKSKSNKNYPSIKKGKKTNIKYASIGKGSIARKQVQHDKMPRQKRKTTKLEQAVNSLDV